MSENLVILASLIPVAWFLERYGKAEIHPMRAAKASAPVLLRSMIYATLMMGSYLVAATLDALG